MKKIVGLVLFSLTALFVQAQKKPEVKPIVRFDGVYQSVGIAPKDGGKVVYHYLRFYEDGVVVSHYSQLPQKDVSKILTKKNKTVDQGLYEMTGEAIYFNITTSDGTTVYDGAINDKYYLDFTGKNLATGATQKDRYYFVKAK